MWVGSIEFDLLLGDVHSLKDKRSIVRPIIAETRRRFQVSVAEVGHLDLHRRSAIGVALVAADHAHLLELMETVERHIAFHPAVELLSARRVVRSSEDS
jgi:uncharacterized protein YlxP (DUF503 family)